MKTIFYSFLCAVLFIGSFLLGDYTNIVFPQETKTDSIFVRIDTSLKVDPVVNKKPIVGKITEKQKIGKTDISDSLKSEFPAEKMDSIEYKKYSVAFETDSTRAYVTIEAVQLHKAIMDSSFFKVPDVHFKTEKVIPVECPVEKKNWVDYAWEFIKSFGWVMWILERKS